MLKKEKYIFPYQISITRGCPFSCKFCSVTRFAGGTYRFRPIEEVLKEVELFKEEEVKLIREISKVIFFIDDNIVAHPSYSKELFKALIPYKIKWIGQATLNIAKNEEVLQLAAESGCIGIFLGFESLNQDSLNLINKRVNNVEEYEEAIKIIHSYGIYIEGSFIFGFDTDDESIFEKTVRFAQQMKIEFANFFPLIPFPGTKIYEEFDHEGRILTKDWSKYDTNVVFKPKLMSPERLKEGTSWATKEFYRTAPIFRRRGIFCFYPFSNWLEFVKVWFT